MRARLLGAIDWFLPPGATEPLMVRRMRAAVAQSALGLFFTFTTGLLYFAFGSPWSGAAISLISAGLVVTPFAIRAGRSIVWVGNLLVALTWVATFVVAGRSGGFSSPAVSWAFLLPVTSYVVCGVRSAVVWGVLAAVQVAVLFAFELAGFPFAQDFSPPLLSVLRITGFAGVLAAAVALLLVVETVRVSSQNALAIAHRTLERERIVRDMHDGVGSQLLGMLLLARAGRLPPERLVPELENSVEDLRLIVDSLDPGGRNLETALGELRARVRARCEAAGITLGWSCRFDDATSLSPAASLHLLRAAQEMLSNAIRHSGGHRVDFELIAAAGQLALSVRDDGKGFDPAHPPRVGRGLNNLRARAQQLGGQLQVSAATPGTRLRLEVPLPGGGQ